MKRTVTSVLVARRAGVGIAIMLAGGVALADSSAPPAVKEVFSKSRDTFVRITPGRSIGDTVGFAGLAKGPFATAEFYRRRPDRSYALSHERALLNPVAPVDFFVTDRGYLATLDNWHNMGYGKVAAFYSPEGDLIRAYELGDLFSKNEIDAFAHSASSIWWRRDPAYIRPDERSLYLSLDEKGSGAIFEIETGAWQICRQQAGKHLCRSTNADRKWTGYVEPKRQG
jgi:hypothetical protein